MQKFEENVMLASEPERHLAHVRCTAAFDLINGENSLAA